MMDDDFERDNQQIEKSNGGFEEDLSFLNSPRQGKQLTLKADKNKQDDGS